MVANPVKIGPEWFASAIKNLELIESNASDYADEEGIAPNQEVFGAVRSFLKELMQKAVVGVKIEDPRIFVSPNGHLVLTFGDKKKKHMTLRFAPEFSFFLSHPETGDLNGSSSADAVELLSKYFQVA